VCFEGVCSGADCTNYTIATCSGTTPCDLRSNTCCLTLSLGGSTEACLAGANTSCGSALPDHCRYSCDCPAGESCCGDVNASTFSGSTTCQLVPSGGSCTPPASGYVTAQLCAEDDECQNGQPCIAQTCLGGTFYFCGLQSEQPYNCKANAIDAGH
jgi:hypothetical protein